MSFDLNVIKKESIKFLIYDLAGDKKYRILVKSL